MKLNVKHAINWLDKMNKKIQDNKDYLTELDHAIGDGDHGINMARGFSEVKKKLDETSLDYESVSDVMKDVAMTVMSKVGGASGPLFGTAFLKISIAFKGSDSVDFLTFRKGIEEALNGMKQRGKADVGEKTLIDVWSPVVTQLNELTDFDADKIQLTAKEAMENTKNTLATKGRASYLKERSVGHIDPGSVSSYYLFEALAEVLREVE